MAVRFKRSYHDRKEAVARRRKTIIKILIVLLFFQIAFSLFTVAIRLDSASMEPGIKRGSALVFSPLVYGFHIHIIDTQLPEIRPPKRGDLVVFTPPYIEKSKGAFFVFSGFVKFLSFGKINLNSLVSAEWDQKLLVKRIIAVPGDTVRMTDFRVSIKPEGSGFFLSEFEVIDRDYDIQVEELPDMWRDDMPYSGNLDTFTLEDEQYFVLGDNRMRSSDSTSWGMLDRDRIEGLVLFKYWPLNQFKVYK